MFSEVQYMADPYPDTVYDGPLVILTSRITASASEIVAGAMQDYGRAVIVGDDHTFGKGTVQSYVDQPGKLGALKVTTALFFRPGGESTQHSGVAADIVLPSLFATDEFGERYTPYSLGSQTITPFLGVQSSFSRMSPFGRGDSTSPVEPTWSPVNDQLLEELRSRSAERVAEDEEFKEIEELLAEQAEEDDVIHLASWRAEQGEAEDEASEDAPEAGSAEGEEATKGGDAAAPAETPGETDGEDDPESKTADEDATPSAETKTKPKEEPTPQMVEAPDPRRPGRTAGDREVMARTVGSDRVAFVAAVIWYALDDERPVESASSTRVDLLVQAADLAMAEMQAHSAFSQVTGVTETLECDIAGGHSRLQRRQGTPLSPRGTRPPIAFNPHGKLRSGRKGWTRAHRRSPCAADVRPSPSSRQSSRQLPAGLGGRPPGDAGNRQSGRPRRRQSRKLDRRHPCVDRPGHGHCRADPQDLELGALRVSERDPEPLPRDLATRHDDRPQPGARGLHERNC